LKTLLAPVVATLLLSGCDLRYALLGFPQPVVQVAGTAPIELEYREAKGGATSTIGVGLFKGRRLIIDYPGKRLFL
jgi:hypothetical protein